MSPELCIFEDKLKILTFTQSILICDWFCFSKTNKTRLRLSLLAVLPHVWPCSVARPREDVPVAL